MATTELEKKIWDFLIVNFGYGLIISFLSFYIIYNKYIEHLIPEDWGKPHFISFGIFFTGLIIELIVFYLSIYLSLMLPNDIYNESMSIESFSGIIIRVLIGIGSGLIFLGIFLIIYYENKKPSMKEKKRRNAENLKKCKNLVSQGRKELSLKEYTKALNNFRQALKVSEGLWDTDLTTEIYNLIRQTERLIFDGKM